MSRKSLGELVDSLIVNSNNLTLLIVLKMLYGGLIRGLTDTFNVFGTLSTRSKTGNSTSAFSELLVLVTILCYTCFYSRC